MRTSGLPSKRQRVQRQLQQNDLALELKILREADIKDNADAERDRRDKEEVRTKAKQMQEWNLKSAALKKQREFNTNFFTYAP